jgi:hypothetical protein
VAPKTLLAKGECFLVPNTIKSTFSSSATSTITFPGLPYLINVFAFIPFSSNFLEASTKILS